MDYINICKTLNSFTGLDILFYEKSSNFSYFHPSNALIGKNKTVDFYLKSLFKYISSLSGDSTSIFEVSNSCFFFVRSLNNNLFFVVGPTSTNIRNRFSVDAYTLTFPVSNDTKSNLIRSLPFISEFQFDTYYNLIQNLNYDNYVVTQTIRPQELAKKNIDEFDVSENNSDITMLAYNDIYKLLHHLTTGNKTAYDDLLNNILDFAPVISDREAKSPVYKVIYGLTMLNSIHLTAAKELNIPLNALLKFEEQIGNAILNIKTFDDAEKVLKLIGSSYIDAVNTYNLNKYSTPINSIINFINSNIYEEITPDKISTYTNYSYSYLLILFKKEVGISLIDYINNQKISEAKFLLEHSDNSITDICFKLKFSNPSTFSRTFKKFAGMSPRTYKSSIKSL